MSTSERVDGTVSEAEICDEPAVIGYGGEVNDEEQCPRPPPPPGLDGEGNKRRRTASLDGGGLNMEIAGVREEVEKWKKTSDSKDKTITELREEVEKGKKISDSKDKEIAGLRGCMKKDKAGLQVNAFCLLV
jgi:hypothetical protein